MKKQIITKEIIEKDGIEIFNKCNIQHSISCEGQCINADCMAHKSFGSFRDAHIQLDVCDDTQKIEKGSLDCSPSDFNQLSKEYLNTVPKYRASCDLPENRAFIAMGLSDTTLHGALNDVIRESYQTIDIELLNGDVIKSPSHAGGLNRACFSELCVQHRNNLYRLEEKSGREIKKQDDIYFIQKYLSCSIGSADRLRYCFKILELDRKSFYSIMNELKIMTNKDRLARLIELEIIAGKLFPVSLDSENFQVYSESENDFDLDQDFFDECPDIPVDNNLFTLKKLGSPDESLSDFDRDEIVNSDYVKYVELIKKYRSNKYDSPKNKLTISAYSQAWVHLNLKKEEFDKIKNAEIQQAAKKLDGNLYDAILQFKKSENKSTRQRLLVSIHGGEWNGEEVKKVDKSTSEMLWRVLNKKM